MKMATYRAGLLQELVFLHLVHPDHHAVRRGDDDPRLRGDIPLRVPEKIGEKTAGHQPQDREPGPAARSPPGGSAPPRPGSRDTPGAAMQSPTFGRKMRAIRFNRPSRLRKLGGKGETGEKAKRLKKSDSLMAFSLLAFRPFTLFALLFPIFSATPSWPGASCPPPRWGAPPPGAAGR